MILVVGATGHVGGETCRLLLQQGYAVRAAVRTSSDTAKVERLRALGAEVVVADLRVPATLAQACDGVSAVISTATAAAPGELADGVIAVDGAGQAALVDAARAAGAGQFVFVSFSPNLDLESPFRTSKRAVETRLQESGLTWTILQPSAFMEVWLSPGLGFDVPNDNLTIYGSGGAPISYVSLYDVAQFCVKSLRVPAAMNRTIPLGGPDALTPLQVARMAESVTGRPMRLAHVPVEALRAQYAAGSEPLQQSFAALMLALAAGDVIDMRATLEEFPVRMRTVREYLHAAFGGGVVAPVPLPQ